MKRIHVAIVLAIHTCSILLGLGERSCFQFTWPGSKNSCENANCKIVPCANPCLNTSTQPNTTDIWNNKDTKPDHFCPWTPDTVCVRYSFKYGDAVANVSYFCGKVIEDQISTITSGCYTQHTGGYTIEVCACQSRDNSMPCNATIRNTYAILITIGATAVTLFVYKIFNIP